MKGKKKLKQIASQNDSSSLKRSESRIRNRAMLKESRGIALKILNRLELLGWSQKKLADKMNVSPQQISKLVKGKENVTLETQIKLQDILDIPILASYYENEKFEAETKLLFETKDLSLVIQKSMNKLTGYESTPIQSDKSKHQFLIKESYRGYSSTQDTKLLLTG